MNWLAHVFLSERDVEYQLGNLLADLVRGPDRARMSPQFLRGVLCHRAIDSFTDAHPVVHRSRARISATHRRFSGVLVDIFYDYCLATQWGSYASMPLDAFTAEFYDAVRSHSIDLPHAARTTLDRIVRHDLLGQYRTLDGVRHSLQRLSAYLRSRWRRDFELENAADELAAHRSAFASDFSEFFPELRLHVEHLEA